ILLYSNTRRSSIIFFNELETLQRLHPSRFTCIHILSQAGSGEPVIQGHLNNGLLETLVDSYLQFPRDRAEFLTCGPPAYMRMVMLTLRYLGFNESQIHRENFLVLPPPPPSPGLGESHEMRIRTGGATLRIRVAPFQNILQAALDQGIPIPYSCRGGVCSTCKCRLLQGKIRMTANEVLTDRDLREGWVLTCTGYPLSDAVEIRLEG
ncbi:MAG TPA: 2Fe-2S iron-sulfur cluster-binding protein, partial [Chitinophagaceae bacterium]|nr:2Fe-2S iron-sulfur cluster-binding protein [Chitinophagaceae bacterium]